jgi:beta-galactosidase beta subunit
MICGNINITKDYSSINENFVKAFEFLKNNNLKELTTLETIRTFHSYWRKMPYRNETSFITL